jgi:hypothetical protein
MPEHATVTAAYPTIRRPRSTTYAGVIECGTSESASQAACSVLAPKDVVAECEGWVFDGAVEHPLAFQSLARPESADLRCLRVIERTLSFCHRSRDEFQLNRRLLFSILSSLAETIAGACQLRFLAVETCLHEIEALGKIGLNNRSVRGNQARTEHIGQPFTGLAQ